VAAAAAQPWLIPVDSSQPAAQVCWFMLTPADVHAHAPPCTHFKTVD
jgi:hypothetical protein